MQEKSVKKTEVFKGRMLGLEQHDIVLEDGTPGYREIVRHPGSVGVLARDSAGRFLLVRQYRMGAEKEMIEVVAGLLDHGEDAAGAARRELLEETAHRAVSLRHMGVVYASPGYVDEKVDVYFADVEPAGVDQELDHTERVDVVTYTREAFAAAVRNGDIQDAKTLACWALFLEQERG